MSQTRILCEKCGAPQCYCKCERKPSSGDNSPSVASTDLFDCPYCGGRPVYAFCMGEHWVRCDTEMCQYETDFHKSEAEAKDAWNKQVLASRLILNKSNPTVEGRTAKGQQA